MKKGQEYTGMVEKVLFPNRGVVTVEGETDQVLIKNVIPGQKVRFVVSKKRKKIEGRLLEVVEPSPMETKEDICQHFPACGGCLYQTLPYKEQIRVKEEQIRDLLSPLLDFKEVYRGISASPRVEGYRNKMELSFGDCEKDGELMLGMHARGSFYDVLDTRDCRLMDEDMQKVAGLTLDYFRNKKVSYYHKRSHEGYLRHLLLRKAAKTGEMLICLVTSTDYSHMYREGAEQIEEEKLLLGWKEALLHQGYNGQLVGILHTKNDRQADVVEDQGTQVLHGRDSFVEELLGLRFVITPFSFFQTNSLGAEVLYEIARKAISSGMEKESFSRVFDLYSGTGTIAQIVSPVAKQVVGVEIVEEAVEAAKENAKKNGIDNVSFIAGDVLKVLDDLSEAPDFIILDPPRDGIHPKAMPKILSYGVERVLYISCKASSLARDLPMFFEEGYKATDLWIVDMFPMTGNVETVVLLSRVK